MVEGWTATVFAGQLWWMKRTKFHIHEAGIYCECQGSGALGHAPNHICQCSLVLEVSIHHANVIQDWHWFDANSGSNLAWGVDVWLKTDHVYLKTLEKSLEVEISHQKAKDPQNPSARRHCPGDWMSSIRCRECSLVRSRFRRGEAPQPRNLVFHRISQGKRETPNMIYI